MIAGSGFCLESPVPVLSPTLYAEIQLQTATTLLIPAEHEERALYVLEGDAQLDGEPVEPHALVILPAGTTPTLFADSDCHAVLFGGAPLDGPRRINWNFVSSDPARIDEARQRWAAGDWPTVPGKANESNCPRAKARRPLCSAWRSIAWAGQVLAQALPPPGCATRYRPARAVAGSRIPAYGPSDA